MSAKRCPLFSAAWNVQCEKREGHKGSCVNGGDGFYGSPPGTLNTPQPPPVTDDAGPEVWPALLAEVTLSPELRALCMERDALGRAKYGTPLRVNNGREPLVDALQESLDLAVYLQQALMRVEGLGQRGDAVSARETHVTEWGLVACAGMSAEEGERSGMRCMTVACGTSLFGINDIVVFDTAPTCPRCAVMRDEALEGRLPKRKENES